MPTAAASAPRAKTRLSVRTTVRAGFLASLAAVAAAGGASWISVFHDPAAAVVTVAAGAAAGVAEPGAAGAAGNGRHRAGRASARARRLRQAACGRRISVEQSVARLRRSELWQRARPYVSADAPTEHWDEGCWRLVCYPAVYDGEPVTAVFALSLGLRQSRNKVAFVDEVERRVLGRLEAGRSES